MPDPTNGQPRTNERRVRYDARDVAAVLGARSRMRMDGKELGDMTPAELAKHALDTKSYKYRMACVAMLLDKIDMPNTCHVLRGLSVMTNKKHANVQSSAKSDQ